MGFDSSISCSIQSGRREPGIFDGSIAPKDTIRIAAIEHSPAPEEEWNKTPQKWLAAEPYHESSGPPLIHEPNFGLEWHIRPEHGS